MAELQRWWRGLKRLILTGAAERVEPAGEAAVLSGREAVLLVGRRLGVRGAGTRDRLATAAGLVTAGVRATTWLTRLDPALALAADQRLPLVAHVALDEAGHAACLAAAQHGWVTLYPQNVQEVVDLTLAAHHLAEHALAPVLVALDAAALADAVQDLRLPDAALCRGICGAAGDVIETPTPAQELMFGATRRRVPRAFDLDRPALHGARGVGLEAAAGDAFFRRHLAELLDRSFAHVAAATGRPLQALQRAPEGPTDLVLVARGAAVEVAEGVAAELRRSSRVAVGVLGMRSHGALPRGRIAELLAGTQAVIALQPAAALAAAEASITPLLQDVRGRHVAYHDFPDHPLRAADLHAFCRAVLDGRRGDVCLGVEFLPGQSDYPKREVLLQALRRDYWDLEGLGLRSDAHLDLRDDGACTVAIARTPTVGGEECAPALAAVLGRAGGAAVRGRLDGAARGYGATDVDILTIGAPGMRDPGADVAADLLVLLHGHVPPGLRLAPSAAVLVPLIGDDTVADLPGATLRALREQQVALYTVPTPHRAAPHEVPVSEVVLGAALGVLAARGHAVDRRRAVAARREALAALPDASRQARLDDFERGFDALQAVDLAALEVPPPAGDAFAVPLAVRHLGGAADALHSVPRFFDHVGVLYRDDEAAALSPDPFLAAGAIPPLTATFHDLSSRRRTIRVFDPAACTGCGACWTVCPDTALGPMALDFDGLLQAGMALCKDDGCSADALRPLVAKVAANAGKRLAGGGAAGDALHGAFAEVLDKMAPPEDRRAALTAAFERVADRVSGLPLAAPAPFAAAGGLLTVAVHVEACKACGACTEVCEAAAIVGAPQTGAAVAAARAHWRVFERLPAAASATLSKLAADPEVGRAATMLLDHRAMFTLSGGDPAEPGSGEKVAVHLLLAAAEHHRRPRARALLDTVTELRERTTGKIHELLAGALPADDLAGLEQGLGAGRHVDLAALVAAAQAEGTPRPVDAAWLRALVHSARQLHDLQDRLTGGGTGMGRAPVGVLVAPGNVAAWAATFPYNPFPVPVVRDRVGATGELARGLCLGQLEAVLDDVRLLRRARLELERPAEAAAEATHIAGLTFADLTPEERALCPPLLLIGGEDSLGMRALTELATVLSGDLPIKLLVLADLDFGLQDTSGLGRQASGAEVAHGDTGLLALAHRRAFVAQGSLADPDRLVDGCLGALRHDGPALIHVHAPSPARHGFATHLTREQARRAVAAGALPLFTYDPAAVGLFGLRLTLHGGQEAGRCFADFAITEGRFAHHFTPLPEAAPHPTPLSEYLALDPARRRGRTPYLQQEGATLQVSAAMVGACDDRRHALQVLQELAGVVTPFTERVEAEAAARTAAEHAHELAALRAEYEARLATLRGELQQEFTVRLRDRLVELAARHRRGADAGAGR